MKLQLGAGDRDHEGLATLVVDAAGDVFMGHCDHAGLRVVIEICGYFIEAQIYDNRHWDYETGTWVVYNKEIK